MINTGYYTQHSYQSYHYTISYQKPQSQMKNLGSATILTEKNDADNDIYRNAAAKAIQAADIDRYSQGIFDLSLLVAGRNADSYFSGSMSSAYDADYFHVDTTSQILSRRPVIITMEMPEGADYDLSVYDEQGNQVGMAVRNEDGTKTLTIPCDWSNSNKFVIKISQHNANESVEGDYKLTFTQGDMPKETKDWLEQWKREEVAEADPERRRELGMAEKEKRDAQNAEGIRRLHQAQYDALPEELKYQGASGAAELLEKEKNGGILSEAEKTYIAIYGNQNEIAEAENIKRKQGLEQEFSDFLESEGLSDKQFTIHLTSDGKAEVSGLGGEQQKAVEDFVIAHWDTFKNVYLTTSGEAVEMTDGQYRIAGYVEECNRFLAGASDGKASVEDLWIEEKLTGKYQVSTEIKGLPSKMADLINSAESTGRFYEYQQMLYGILEYKKVYGEIPQFYMDFSWDGQELQF